MSGKDKQGVFESILENLTDQGALAGFGAYVFTLHVIQKKQIEVVSAQFVDRTRILEALLQKEDENVRENQLRIIELESTLEKEKRKVNIKEGAGTPGPSGFGRGNGAPQQATNSPYFRILRDNSSTAAATSETGRRSVSGRKSMSMLVGANGEMSQMNESEKIREYFQNTENRLPEDRPHDRVELVSNVETMIEANAVFQQAVVAAGANEGSILVNVESLTPNELTKFVTLVESMVGVKDKSRAEWGTMSDANRFLSGVMAKTTVNRPVLVRALRMETVPVIIDTFTVMYTEAVQAVPQDGKKLDRVQKILTSRNQDQQILTVELKSLLAKHCTMLANRLESKDKDKVTLSDIANNGFAVLIECKLHLDAAHVRDHVRGLIEILEYSESFGPRYHGSIATFAEGLWEDLGAFEERTGKIDKDLIYELELLKIMSDSQEKTMKEFRKQVVDNPHQGFSSEFHSLSLMRQKFDTVLEAATAFTRTQFGEIFSKSPMDRDEWLRRSRGNQVHFVRGVNPPPCTVCGGFHSAANGCNVAVNLKRVADEAGPVLKDIGEVLTAVSKIQSELAKGKDCGEVFGNLTNFVQTGGEMLKRLNGALDYSKQRLKTSTLNQPRMQDTQALPASDSPKTTVADIITQKNVNQGKPGNLCYGWERHGEYKRGVSFPFSHPDAYKGTKKGPGGAGAQPAKTTGPAATAPAVPTVVPTAQADGPVANTLCKQCNKKERYREGGKVHPYCGKSCAEEAIGRKIGQPQQDTKLSNNAMIQEEDSSWMGSNYMALAGISHVEMWVEATSLGFVAAPVNAADEGSIYSPGMVELLQSMWVYFHE